MIDINQIGGFRSPLVFNPWDEFDPLDASGYGWFRRRVRLGEHFNIAAPKFLLIGEAPGYQGCHFSGVPFTNEKLILEGVIPRVREEARFTTRRLPWSEPSATIVWRTLHNLGIAESTVMWNAFAWHPHKPDVPMSNRSPTEKELFAGLDVLQMVVDHFRNPDPVAQLLTQPVMVVAVGRTAEKALKKLNITTAGAARHPSMGGAKEFAAGMGALVKARWSLLNPILKVHPAVINTGAQA